MLLSRCAGCGSKISIIIKGQESSRLLSSLRIRMGLYKVPVVGPISITKNKERIPRFKETGDLRYIYQNKLRKACFQHDMTYRDVKNLPRRKAANKVLRDKAFNI